MTIKSIYGQFKASRPSIDWTLFIYEDDSGVCLCSESGHSAKNRSGERSGVWYDSYHEGQEPAGRGVAICSPE